MASDVRSAENAQNWLNNVVYNWVSSLSLQSASPHGGFFAVASDYFESIEPSLGFTRGRLRSDVPWWFE
jgi:hypothetical protein